jgi:hypothetical protein
MPNGRTDDIPEEVKGIPVTVERRPRAVPTCYTGYQDPLEGGVANSCDSTGGKGTLCCRVKDYRNGAWRKYILGCRHMFMSDGNPCTDEDASTRDWWQDTEAGTVIEGFQHHDCTLLDNSKTSRNISNTVIDETGRVAGRVTANGLSCLKSTDETVQKRGRTTCKTAGKIKKIQQEIFCPDGDYIGGVVRSTPQQEAGDSGGPVYYEKFADPDQLYIVNIATHKPGDGTHDAKGSSANSMHEKQGFWFGGDSYSGSC